MGDSGRAVTRDERVAMALAQSHENLAAAAVKFEESQERNSRLLGGLRGWFDGFTGTARPEDTNPIAAMLPEPGLESEVVALMTDCQVCFRCALLAYMFYTNSAECDALKDKAGSWRRVN